jgi:hypothetical protein
MEQYSAGKWCECGAATSASTGPEAHGGGHAAAGAGAAAAEAAEAECCTGGESATGAALGFGRGQRIVCERQSSCPPAPCTEKLAHTQYC